jgi:hypothetical protein
MKVKPFEHSSISDRQLLGTLPFGAVNNKKYSRGLFPENYLLSLTG